MQALVRPLFVDNLIVAFWSVPDLFEVFWNPLAVCFQRPDAGHLELVLQALRDFVRGVKSVTIKRNFR